MATNKRQAVYFKYGNFYFGSYTTAKEKEIKVWDGAQTVTKTVEVPPAAWARIHKVGYGVRRVNWINPDTGKAQHLGFVRCTEDETGKVLRARLFRNGKINEDVMLGFYVPEILVKEGKWFRTAADIGEDMDTLLWLWRKNLVSSDEMLEIFPTRFKELRRLGVISEEKYLSCLTPLQRRARLSRSEYMTNLNNELKRRAALNPNYRRSSRTDRIDGIQIKSEDFPPVFDDPLSILRPVLQYHRRGGKFYRDDPVTGESYRLPSKPKFRSIRDCQKWYWNQILQHSAGIIKLDHHPIMEVAAYNWSAVMGCLCDEYVKRLRCVFDGGNAEYDLIFEEFNKENYRSIFKVTHRTPILKKVQEEFREAAEKMVNGINAWAADPKKNPVVAFRSYKDKDSGNKHFRLVRMIDPMPDDFLKILDLFIVGTFTQKQAELRVCRAPAVCFHYEETRRRWESAMKSHLDSLLEELSGKDPEEIRNHPDFGKYIFQYPNSEDEFWVKTPHFSRFTNWYPEIGMKNRDLAEAESLADAAFIAMEYGTRLYIRGHLWSNTLKFVYQGKLYRVSLGTGVVQWLDERTFSEKESGLNPRKVAAAVRHAENVYKKVVSKGANQKIATDCWDSTYRKDIDYDANKGNAVLLKQVAEANEKALERVRLVWGLSDKRALQALASHVDFKSSGVVDDWLYAEELKFELPVAEPESTNFRMSEFKGEVDFEVQYQPFDSISA